MQFRSNYERCKACGESTHTEEAACLHCGAMKSWARARPNRRSALGRTAKRVLATLAEHGAVPLSHGARYAEIHSGQMRVMASTNYLLRSQGMVEWAGGNYGRWHVRITDYGRECLARGSHIPGANRAAFSETYGPR